MKNVFLYLIIILLGVISCSDNDEPVKNTSKLVVKLEQISTNDGSVDVSKYDYNSENKLLKIRNGNNDIVTNEVIYDDKGNLTRLIQKQDQGEISDNYEYLNNKLVKETRKGNSTVIEVIEYKYDNNSLVLKREQDVFNGGTATVREYSYEYNGNTVRRTDTSTGSYAIIKYDGKNIPFSDEEGLRKIFPFNDLGNELEVKIYINNTLDHTKTNTITYDGDEYPVKIIIEEVTSSGQTWGEVRNYTYNK